MSSPKRFLSLLAMLLLVPVSGAWALEAVGTLHGPVQWAGEVILPQQVTVAPEAALTIAPGTVVRPQTPEARLVVAGQLRVEGTASAPVTFAAPEGWQGIELTGAQPGSVISHAEFSQAETAISGVAAAFTLRHCSFRGGATAVKLMREAQARIEDNLFVDNRVGIDSEMKSRADIRGNRFVGHRDSAILLSHSSVGAIVDNSFEKNKQGLRVLQKYPDRISGNRFTGNETGIYCNQTEDTPEIRNNTFEGNGVGLLNLSFASPLVENNRFVGNRVAIRNDQFGSPRVLHNLFRDNRTAVYNYRKSNPLLEKNRIEQSEVAIFCDYSSYPQVHRNNFVHNGMGVRLGIYQSGDWERRYGSQATSRRPVQAQGRAMPAGLASSDEVNDVIDVSNNWWGEDTAKLQTAGADGNLEMFYDRRDRPRVYYEGYDAQGYIFDVIRFSPWLTAPVADGGPAG